MVEVINVDNSKEPQKTLNTLYEMQQDQILTDVVLIAKEDGIKIPVHRNILSARCEYFRVMFSINMSESMQTEVSLSEVSGDDLKNIIKYIYTGEIEISEDNMGTIMAAAHHFLLMDVVNACRQILELKINVSNCLSIWAIAELQGHTNLMTAARSYACDYFTDVCKSDEFSKLNEKQLRKLLASDELSVSKEDTVFESIMEWLQHNKVERMKYIRELLPLVRVSFLSPSFIMDQKQLISDTINDQQLHEYIMTWYLTADVQPASNSRRNMCVVLLAVMTDQIDIPIHKYNQHTDEWTLCKQIIDGRTRFGAAIMNDELIIAGGNLTNRLVNTITSVNTITMSSKTLNPMGTCRELASLVVFDEFLYVIGGDDEWKSVERWDRRTGLWAYVAPMNLKRYGHAAEVLNGYIYVVGGGTCTVEAYNPYTNSWAMKKPMNETRWGHRVAVLNGFLYAVGGDRSKTVERYDPKTNTWTMIGSLKTKRYNHGCIALRNCLICVGGYCSTDSSIVEEYDAINDVWTEKSPLSDSGPCILVLARCHKS